MSKTNTSRVGPVAVFDPQHLIFEDASPKSVLEHRTLSGLAVALTAQREQQHEQGQQQEKGLVLSSPRCVNAHALKMVAAGVLKKYNTFGETPTSPSPLLPSSSHSHTFPMVVNASLSRSFQETHPSGKHLLEQSSMSLECIFYASPPFDFLVEHCAGYAAADDDFLSNCFFCKRALMVGQDAFMYRGDQAFCSAECRYEQIVMDERKGRCPM